MEQQINFPKGTAITWNDVYAFCGNNVVGRKTRERFARQYPDAGQCLWAIADSLHGPYFPANYYWAVTEYDMTEDQYHAAVRAAAEEIYEQRKLHKDETLEYWIFAINNCRVLLERILERDNT